jgi:hypothetical protein
MNGFNDFRLGQVEQIVVSLEVYGMIGEVTAIAGFVELAGLNHRSHGPIEYQDPVPKQLLDRHGY